VGEPLCFRVASQSPEPGPEGPCAEALWVTPDGRFAGVVRAHAPEGAEPCAAREAWFTAIVVGRATATVA